MTAPIQEPSTDRALQGFAYARDQIFRRPPPTPGAGELPFAWMEWLTGGDVGNDAELGPEDLDGGTPYENCFVSASGMDFGDMGFTPDLDEGVINWCATGLYLAQFVVIWADTWTSASFASFVQTKLNLIGGSESTGACCSWATREYIHNDWQVANFVATGMFHTTQPVDCEINPNGIKGTVWQKSGVDKFLSSAALIITRLSDDAEGYFCLS